MKTKPKLLILNGSHSEIPLIQSGKKAGYHVITTGNAPDLIGHQYADEYHNADFSDKGAILALAKLLNIDAICACANDFGIITAAFVGEQLGLEGHDSYQTTLQLHHKDKFKTFALNHNITTPAAQSYKTVDEALASAKALVLPVMVKPIDMSGGKGITCVENPDQLRSAIEKAYSTSKQQRIVIEEFISGSHHSLSTFVVGGKVRAYFCDNEYSYINPFLISTSAAPAKHDPTIIAQLINEVECVTELLNLVDGVVHVQYIATDKLGYIIEITRRCSGDLYPWPVNLASGIVWEDWIIRAETGADCSAMPSFTQRGFVGRHCIMSKKNGVIEKISFSDDIRKNIAANVLLRKEGERVNDFTMEKLGIVVLRFDTQQDMDEKISSIDKHINVVITNN